MNTISDDYMKQMMTTTKPYSVVILKAGPNHDTEGAQKIIWEHARRNFQLRAEGKLSVVCPVRDDTSVNGIGIFSTDPVETKKIMDEDPGVMTGIFIYEIHPSRSFPGDRLP